MGRKAFALLCWTLAACAPEAGTVDIAVLQWDPATGVYALEPATLTTLEDVGALRGEAARAIGSAVIVIDGSRLARVSTEKQFRDVVLEDAGGCVRAEFIEQDGVLYPSDFHSLNLATAYFNFERARAYALARGMSADRLRSVPFYYFPEVHMAGSGPDGELDNAAWFPLLRSFLLFPFEKMQEIPLAMNQGVIAHEYGHGIFNAEVHAGAWNPAYLGRWCPGGSCPEPRGVRMIDAVEEGFADAWAVGVTRDPLFTHHSISELGDSRVPARFVRRRHCYSQAAFEHDLRAAAKLPQDDQLEYWNGRKYQIGTVLAGALYRAGCFDFTPDAELGCRVDDRCMDGGDWSRYDRVMETLLASYATGDRSLAALIAADPDGAEFGQFAHIARAVIAAAPETETRRALCSAWMDRLAIEPEELGPLCDDVGDDHGACTALEADAAGALCIRPVSMSGGDR